MSALTEEIRAIIATEGPISLERYMALALGHPRHGYYTTGTPIGAAGDFITAPEISQMFGELIGLWAAEVWAAQGRPDPVRLVELGPGRGTLMADALRAARVLPAFRAALDVRLVETSPSLTAVQQMTLAGQVAPEHWHGDIDAVPTGPALIVANELFDALPVRHYVHDGAGWRERLIGLDAAGALTFGLSGAAETVAVAGTRGTVLEVGVAAQSMMARLAARIVRDGGALLAIDYGAAGRPDGPTLQAVRGHRAADPLDAPGTADLTAHVDFAALGAAARAAGAVMHGPVPQGVFLERLGIRARAARLKRDADASVCASIDAALERLVGTAPGSGTRAGMGALFKVVAVTRHDAPVPPGFEAAV
jgi:SAM-dependent MidA family methyltransferase